MKVRHRRLKWGWWVVILGVCGVLGGVVVIMLMQNGVPESSEMENVVEEVKEPEEYELSLVMVGDALIHEEVYEDAARNAATEVAAGEKLADSGTTAAREAGASASYDFRPMLSRVREVVGAADLAYYNQETVLGGVELGLSGYPRFNSPTEVGDAFVEAGFNLVSLATNHTMDKGEAGVLNSVEYWKEVADDYDDKNNEADERENWAADDARVVTSGQWSSAEERAESVQRIYEKNGIKYAFLAYTTWTNGLETPADKEYLNNVYSAEKAVADVAAVREEADVVLVAMHWGTEYSLGASAAQEEIAQYLAGLGVDVIIGAHPHVVEPIEYIDKGDADGDGESDGQTLVIYSLGNFVSDQEGVERLTGLMAGVKIRKVVEEVSEDDVDADAGDFGDTGDAGDAGDVGSDDVADAGSDDEIVMNVRVAGDEKTTVSLADLRAELLYTYNQRHRGIVVYPYSELDNSLLNGFADYQAKYRGVVEGRGVEVEWGM